MKSRRGRKPAYWSKHRPDGGSVLYKIHQGCIEYRGYNPCGSMEPHWLRFLNLANGYIPVRNCEIVRSYLEKRSPGQVRLGPYLWFSHQELDLLDKFIEKGEKVSPSMEHLVHTSWPRDIGHWLKPQFQPLEGVKRLPIGPHGVPDVRNVPHIFQVRIPGLFLKRLGIKARYIKSSFRNLNYRLRSLVVLTRLLYMVKAIYYEGISPSSPQPRSWRKAAEKSVGEGVEILLLASVPNWHGIARRLYNRLMVNLSP